MAIKSGDFRDLYDGPVFTKRKTGTKDCPGYCLKPQELSKCPNECDCAWAREVVDYVPLGKTTRIKDILYIAILIEDSLRDRLIRRLILTGKKVYL
ncbi:MAG: hypothetical protein Q7J65_07675 [Candidatus Marinimicrobia bacterium]|nr:hypothetical protein [Candidatus Neomarinimicrobiota bacterium]